MPFDFLKFSYSRKPGKKQIIGESFKKKIGRLEKKLHVKERYRGEYAVIRKAIAKARKRWDRMLDEIKSEKSAANG